MKNINSYSLYCILFPGWDNTTKDLSPVLQRMISDDLSELRILTYFINRTQNCKPMYIYGLRAVSPINVFLRAVTSIQSAYEI